MINGTEHETWYLQSDWLLFYFIELQNSVSTRNQFELTQFVAEMEDIRPEKPEWYLLV